MVTTRRRTGYCSTSARAVVAPRAVRRSVATTAFGEVSTEEREVPRPILRPTEKTKRTAEEELDERRLPPPPPTTITTRVTIGRRPARRRPTRTIRPAVVRPRRKQCCQPGGQCSLRPTVACSSSITTRRRPRGWIRGRVEPARCRTRLAVRPLVIRAVRRTDWHPCPRAGRSEFTPTGGYSSSITVRKSS